MFGISDLFNGATRLVQVVADAFADLGYALASNPGYLLIAGIVLAVLAVALLRAR